MTLTPKTVGGGRAQLRLYAEVVALWMSRFDTFEIGERLGMPEHVAARYVANFRDVVREQ